MSIDVSSRLRAGLIDRKFSRVWLALAGLLLVSLVLAPTSVSGRQLNNLIFFSSLLGIVALGQLLVVASGGLDLSTPAAISLAGLIFAGTAGNSSRSILLGGLAAVAATAGVGLLNGIAVSWLRITPLIATLGVGSIAQGFGYAVHGTGSPNAAPRAFIGLVTQRYFLEWFSLTTIVWLMLAVAMAVTLRRTTFGKRFIAVGDRATAARIAGMHIKVHRMSAYVIAGTLYGIAGLAITGVSTFAGRTLGDQYLLTPIAAVVVGGSPLGGGLASVSATIGGSLFMTQLNGLTLSLRASTAVQLIVQGGVIAIAMTLQRRLWFERPSLEAEARLMRDTQPSSVIAHESPDHGGEAMTPKKKG